MMTIVKPPPKKAEINKAVILRLLLEINVFTKDIIAGIKETRHKAATSTKSNIVAKILLITGGFFIFIVVNNNKYYNIIISFLEMFRIYNIEKFLILTLQHLATTNSKHIILIYDI